MEKKESKENAEAEHPSNGESNSSLPSRLESNPKESIEELIQKQSELELPEEEEDRKQQEEIQSGEEIEEAIDEEEELRKREAKLSDEELQSNKEKSDRLKLEGNELFKKGDAEHSIKVYSEALELCPSKYTRERAILYGNRAAAKIKLDSRKSAIDDCSKAINLWPEYVRAVLRRAKLYENEDNLDCALKDYERVYELDPGQHEAREAMVRLPRLIEERNERMKTEMISKLKDLGNMILNPFGLSTSNFEMQQDPNTGGYSINFKQNQS